MSTDDTISGHPDLEALSAHGDGETDGAEASAVEEHVAGCAECRTKLRWMRTASALVATPVPPRDPSARDQAIARALDSMVEGVPSVTDEPWIAGTGASVGARPVTPPLRPRPAAPVPISAARRGRSRRGDRSAVWIGVGSAAAVVVAVLVGVGVLGQGGSRDDNATVAAGPTQERSATDLAGDSAGAGVSGATGTLAAPSDTSGGVNGGDLGDIADAATLASRARSVLVQRQAAPEAAPPVAGLASADADTNLTPKVVGTRPCEMEVRSARPGLGTVVYFATGRFEGVPVVVLGFVSDPAASGPAASGLAVAPVTLLALAQGEGCRVVLEAAGP